MKNRQQIQNQRTHKADVRAVVAAVKLVGKPRKQFSSTHKPVKGKNGISYTRNYRGKFTRAEVNEVAGRVVNSMNAIGLTDEQIGHAAKLVSTTLINRADKH